MKIVFMSMPAWNTLLAFYSVSHLWVLKISVSGRFKCKQIILSFTLIGVAD